jgi:hypothetical protein
MWDDITPGKLCMWMGSLHVFHGDMKSLKRKVEANANAS